MRAAKVFGPRDVRVVETPVPTAAAGQVTIKVEYAGICGSDLMIYDFAPFPPTYVHPLLGDPGPHTLGHEFSGRVTEIGSGVAGFDLGDLVTVQPSINDHSCPACRRGETNLCEHAGFLGVHGGGGGFSEFVSCAADKVFHLPEPFTAKTGALVECLAVAWHAVRTAGARPATTALVIGAGPVGMAVLLALRAHGVERVLVQEPSPERRRMAESFGAELVTGDKIGPVDLAFEVAGVGEKSFGVAIDSVRPGGMVVVVAHFHEPIPFDLNQVMQSELTIRGSVAYTKQDFEEVIEAVRTGRLDPSPLVTREIALDQIVSDGLKRLQTVNGRASDIKILVSPVVCSAR